MIPKPRIEDPNKISVRVISGVEGWAVYLNDHRICGPKPWGGGDVIFNGQTTMNTLERALPIALIKEGGQGPGMSLEVAEALTRPGWE